MFANVQVMFLCLQYCSPTLLIIHELVILVLVMKNALETGKIFIKNIQIQH